MISLIAIASTARSIFNEAAPAVIENSRKRLIEIDNTIKPLLEKGLKDGAPDAAIVAQIEALESEAKQLGVLQNAAERSFAMNAIPESERFQSEFKLSKSEERDLSKFSLLEACNVANNDRKVDGILYDLRIEAQKELQKIPFFVRGKARRNTERYAQERGLATITVETLYDAKAHFSR
mgnify:CR=1 FL=1